MKREKTLTRMIDKERSINKDKESQTRHSKSFNLSNHSIQRITMFHLFNYKNCEKKKNNVKEKTGHSDLHLNRRLRMLINTFR